MFVSRRGAGPEGSKCLAPFGLFTYPSFALIRFRHLILIALWLPGIFNLWAADFPADAEAANQATIHEPLSAVERRILSSNGDARRAERAERERPGDANLLGSEISSVPKRFIYSFRASLRGVYDDNIFLRHNDPIGDFYFAIEPGVTLGYGDIVGRERNFIRLDYSPSIFLYASHANANAFQHLIRLDSEYRFGRLTMDLGIGIELREGANPASLSGASTSNPGPAVNLDAGGDTEVNVYSLAANLSYDLTGKTFLTGSLRFSANEYADLISSQLISGDLFINYTYSPKLTVGLGGTAGYNLVDRGSPDQTFQQLNLRLTYQLTGKISLNGSVGLEFRQFDNGSGGKGTYISPVYEMSATYLPFDGTTITLSGNRRTQNSAVFQGQDYSSTTITLGARQRFLRRLYFGAVVGYENSSYFSTAPGIDASREDNYFFIQPSVDVTLTNFWTVGAYYLHRQSNSSSDFFSFNDNQFGLRTSLTF